MEVDPNSLKVLKTCQLFLTGEGGLKEAVFQNCQGAADG